MKTSESKTPYQLEILRERLRRAISHKYFIPICVLLGFILRLLWIWLINAPQVSDYEWYYERAVNIAAGKGYSVSGLPTAYWPVGYPGFLGAMFSITGPSLLFAKLANVILYMGVILFAYLLSRKLFYCERAARITLCILALYPNHIAYTALLSAEILFAFLLMLGAVCFVSAKNRAGLQAALAGLAWGFAVLTKPQAIFVPLIFLLVFFSGLQPFLRSGAVIYLIIILVVTPWVIRNYVVMGTPQLDTHGGVVLFEGNNPYATGRANWTPQVASLLGDLAVDEAHMNDGKELRRESRAREVALRYMMSEPTRTILLWPRKLWAICASDVDGIYYSMGIELIRAPSNRLKKLNWGFRAAGELYYLFIVILFCRSLAVLRKSKRAVSLIGILLCVYLMMVYLVFEGNARFHFAMMPWVAVYAGIGGSLFLNSFAVWPLSASSSQYSFMS
jgi:hypothetical protein